MLLAVAAIVICCALFRSGRFAIWVKAGVGFFVMLLIVPIATATVSLVHATTAITNNGFVVETSQGVMLGWVVLGTSACGFFFMTIALSYGFKSE